jgi:predicted transcriptional regulator of viral defense system
MIKKVRDNFAENDAMTSADVLSVFQSRSRYCFTAEDFERTSRVPAGSRAAQLRLSRLTAQKKICLLSHKPSIWLIVPPEYSRLGAPPMNWWVDDFMRTVAGSYYLALLSAARHWGSAHYALQTEQIMIGHARKPTIAGRQKLTFFSRLAVESTPVVKAMGEKASFLVSTREATLLDLVRHSDHVGGVEAIARIAKDFAPKLTKSGMVEALNAMGQVAVAQRLGFILATLGIVQVAQCVERWLAHRRLARRFLSAPINPTAVECLNKRWRVVHTLSERQTILELS